MRREYVEEVTTTIKKQKQIRNISVIAHVDHGKTTLVDSLLAKAGIIKEENAGKMRVMDTKKEEQERGITIKSTGISLLFSHEDGAKYVINLVDSPGHVDFSSEVTAALRITDGALVVVDCVEGVCVQTKTVTRQALTERIKPVLHVNKVDRGIMELNLSPEDLYLKLDSVVQEFNTVLETYQESQSCESFVDPRKGTVSFGSGKQGWAFSLPQIAKIVAKKMGKDSKAILRRLWGENFYDPESKKFYTVPVSPTGAKLERYVCSVILKPLIQVFNMVANSDIEGLEKILPAIGVKLTKDEKDLRGQELLSRVLQLWLPAGDALANMIIDHLPSPVEAQKYRVESLYTGPLDDDCANAIRNCDPEGPAMMFVSKMVPSADGKRYYAYGRLFSGTLKAQMEVKIMGANYIPGEKTDLAKKKITRLVLMMGKYIENVAEVPCGNTVGIVGVDNALVKSGTISSSNDAFPISPMKFSVSPVVRCAVTPKNTAQLPKFVSGLKSLEKSDPCLQIIISEKGECIIAGAGQLHVEVALNDLREIVGKDLEFIVSPPIVEYCESVRAKSPQPSLAKSPNKHNRIYISAEPLDDKLVEALEKDKINLTDKKELFRQLTSEFNWDQQEARKLWFFKGTNCVVDATTSSQYMHEIRDHVSAALEWTIKEAGLCQEPMRGIKFSIIDVVLHADTIHRGPGQILPTVHRALLAAQLNASPCIMEPVYLAEIQTEQELANKIFNVLSTRRGFVFDETPNIGTPLCTLKAYLPVRESFGFDSDLRAATSGRAFPQLLFSHWQVVEGDPYKATTKANDIVVETRARKQLKEALPTTEDFTDKL